MKIQVFVRHCHYSTVSLKKERLPGYSREKCHENLLQNADRSQVEFTFLLDTFHPMEQPHFIKRQTDYPVVEFAGGTETASFLFLLEYAVSRGFSDETILYFLEDDYLHRPGWVDILIEGFSLEKADYITLFDHGDKYQFPEFESLPSILYHTRSCHWRTTPSTTNTHAMRLHTLKKHYEVHRAYSLGRKITLDHAKFLRLGEMGARLISAVPGWSTHVEPKVLSPIYEWEKLLV
jgi:hypothetical protein